MRLQYFPSYNTGPGPIPKQSHDRVTTLPLPNCKICDTPEAPLDWPPRHSALNEQFQTQSASLRFQSSSHWWYTNPTPLISVQLMGNGKAGSHRNVFDFRYNCGYMASTKCILNGLSYSLFQSIGELLSRSHLHKEQNPFIFVEGSSLAYAQCILHGSRKFFQNGIYFCGPKSDTTRIENPITDEMLSSHENHQENEGTKSHLRPRTRKP